MGEDTHPRQDEKTPNLYCSHILCLVAIGQAEIGYARYIGAVGEMFAFVAEISPVLCRHWDLVWWAV